MTKPGCLNRVVFFVLLVVAFGFSSFFWFRIFVRGSSIPAPNLIGRSLTEARAMASDAGLVLEVDNSRDRNSDTVPLGAVVWQNRAGGSHVKRGTRLIAGQSLGPLVIRVPDLTGQSPRTALLRFSQRNLRLGNLSYVPRETAGIVSADPPVDTVVPGQTAVSLLVGFATPPAAYVMPDLIDRSFEEVRPSLEATGLRVSNVRYEAYPGIQDGVIIRQYPLGGFPVTSRDPITLVVTRQEDQSIIQQPGPEEVPTQ
jgi:beta-lactam-binding protein with PASTA domain